MGLSVTDYNQESKPSRVFTDFGIPMSNSELQEIGACLFNGHAANVTSYVAAYRDNLEITIGFRWWGADHKIDLKTWSFTVDNFQFFTSDGTPLAEAYPDYEMRVEPAEFRIGYIWVILRGKQEATDADAKALIAQEPYMLFTGDDGSTIKIPLLNGYSK